MPFKYENLPLEKGSLVERHNVLTVEIMPLSLATSLTQTQQQSLSQKYKKLVLVATQEQQTVFK